MSGLTFINDPSVLYTPESFTEVHLDNIGDQISNAILDAMLAQDPLTWRIELQVTRTIGEVETILRGSFTGETSVRSRFRKLMAVNMSRFFAIP